MNPVTFVPAGTDGKPLARVCILGEPGAGKTRLAGTFPSPLFLDLENGASTAHPDGVNRVVIPTDRSTMANVRAVIAKLAKSKLEDGHILYQAGEEPTVSVGTLVLDSIDAVQQPVKMFDILRGRTKMERGDWDTMLNLMTPLVLEWHALPIHVVVIAHTKRTDGEQGKPGSMDFGVQGSLRVQMPRWFDYILHIVAGPDGERFVVTQPTISKGYRYLAKDRHGKLADMAAKGILPLPDNGTGYPDSTIAKVVCRQE